MKSVRVATLEVNEGEGMRGSSHFTGRPRAGFFTHFSRLRSAPHHIPDAGLGS